MNTSEEIIFHEPHETWTLEDIRPDISHIETEDDTPVDNIFSEKQMRLLTETLYASWQREKPFLAMADVGLFYARRKPALVPDVMLSLDVEAAKDWFQKENRSYFTWEFGKPPEVVIEIVSNFKGEELGTKMEKYGVAHVPYYVVYDPAQNYGKPPLRLFEHNGWDYAPMTTHIFAHVGLGLVLWEGVFEGRMDTWLRWCDTDGNVIPTGRERAEAAESRTEAAESRTKAAESHAGTEKQRAEAEKQRAEAAESRAEALAAKLRAFGINPDEA